jgi:hypothetical protein
VGGANIRQASHGRHVPTGSGHSPGVDCDRGQGLASVQNYLPFRFPVSELPPPCPPKRNMGREAALGGPRPEQGGDPDRWHPGSQPCPALGTGRQLSASNGPVTNGVGCAGASNLFLPPRRAPECRALPAQYRVLSTGIWGPIGQSYVHCPEFCGQFWQPRLEGR